MITLTDSATVKVRSCSATKVPTIWHCASPSAPAAAAASPTRCSSTATSPPTTRRSPTATTDSSRSSSTRRRAQLLEGATLDYKDGLDQSGFAITNPNASRTCGCGQSFC